VGGCLKEQDLIELLLNEASAPVQNHVKACLPCSRRYRKLAEDMKVISAVLRGRPPKAAERSRSWSRLAVVAPVCASALFLFMAGMWIGESLQMRGGEKLARHLPQATAQPVARVMPGETMLASSSESLSASDPITPVALSYVNFLEDTFSQDDSCASRDNSFDPACSSSWFSGETP